MGFQDNQQVLVVGSIKNLDNKWKYEARSHHTIKNYFDKSVSSNTQFKTIVTHRSEYSVIISNYTVFYLYNYDIIGIEDLSNDKNIFPSNDTSTVFIESITNTDDILIMNKKNMYYVYFDKNKSNLELEDPLKIKTVSPSNNISSYISCKLQGHRLCVHYKPSKKLGRGETYIAVIDLDIKMIFPESDDAGFGDDEFNEEEQMGVAVDTSIRSSQLLFKNGHGHADVCLEGRRSF